MIQSAAPASLRTLHLDCPAPTALGPLAAARLAVQLPALRALHLTDACGLTDEALAGLAGRLTDLTDLGLLGCRNLRGVALRDIAAACPRLRSLAISRSTVQAIAFEPVSRLERLESLSVAACARTDYTPVLNLVAACPRTPLRAGPPPLVLSGHAASLTPY